MCCADALFWTGMGLCALLALLTMVLLALVNTDRIVARSSWFLVAQNVGALIFFSVVLLYFSNRVALPFYIDATGDLGQCAMLWVGSRAPVMHARRADLSV